MTIREFTLEVKGFPNQKITSDKIEEFFQNLCENQEGFRGVTNVTLAYKFKNSLENILKVSENKLKCAEYRHKITLDRVKQYQKLRYSILINKLLKQAKEQNKIAKKKLGLGPEELIDYRRMEDQTILKAFVSFEDTKTRDQVRELLNTV